jgi:hypothetical protein
MPTSLGIEDLVEGLRRAGRAAQSNIDRREVLLAEDMLLRLAERQPALARMLPLKSSRITGLSVDLPVAIEEVWIDKRPRRKVLALKIGRPSSTRAPQFTLCVEFSGAGLSTVETRIDGVPVDLLSPGAPR